LLHGVAASETLLVRYAICGAFNIVFKDLDSDGVQGAIILTEPEADAVRGLIAKAVRVLIDQSGADEERFLQYMQAPSIEQIPRRSWAKALSALEEKRAKEKPSG
jgi:hypothetical protein